MAILSVSSQNPQPSRINKAVSTRRLDIKLAPNLNQILPQCTKKKDILRHQFFIAKTFIMDRIIEFIINHWELEGVWMFFFVALLWDNNVRSGQSVSLTEVTLLIIKEIAWL